VLQAEDSNGPLVSMIFSSNGLLAAGNANVPQQFVGQSWVSVHSNSCEACSQRQHSFAIDRFSAYRAVLLGLFPLLGKASE
jgi:hypothetical protein